VEKKETPGTPAKLAGMNRYLGHARIVGMKIKVTGLLVPIASRVAHSLLPRLSAGFLIYGQIIN